MAWSRARRPEETTRVSIKPDKWIRRMALERKMIEPFEPTLVRSVGGQRAVSFGTSSYGYDVRCADEFKDRKSTRLNYSHNPASRMPSSA
jgi:deoxycytidine triphosphate deaminase